MKNYFLKICISLFLFILFFNMTICFAADYENSSSEKIVYLTFDDGPAGKVTNDILDILKKENVHATFFLIGNQMKNQEKLLKRMVDEGHSLGLHSMSHRKCYLYSSSENFLSEMKETQQLLESITGIKSNIIRFPFGCNNNSYKITENMVDLLHQNNFKIYDWNVDSGDGANPNSPPCRFVKNSVSTKKNIVLLMHCAYMSKNTAAALPDIIKYYKNNDYEFKIITENTPEEFHYIKKCR